MIARTILAGALSLGLTSAGWTTPRGASLQHAEVIRCYEAARKPCSSKEADQSTTCLKEALGKCQKKEAADR